MFPGRRHAGRIFFNEVRLSGAVPQVCVLFGPSAAGGAYIPAFCDVVIMRDGNASMYLGSPRMAEMVIGEKVSLEEMGGAKMHTGVSGCGHFLVKSDEEGIDLAKRYLGFFGSNAEEEPPAAPPGAPPADAPAIRDLIPADENKPWNMHELIDAVVDEGSFLEVHKRWAKELICGYARLDGRAVGHRRQPAEVQGRRAVRGLRRQGGALHLDLQRLRHPAAVPGRRAGLHDRHGGRAPGHHPPRREDDLGRLGGDRAEDLGDRPQGLRRRALRDGRPGLRPRLHARAAVGEDRGDGAERRRQRRLLQPAPGDRGRARARRAPARADGRVRRGRRPAAPRLGDGDRRDRAAGGPARRARAPLRPLRRQAARVARASATRSRRRDGRRAARPVRPPDRPRRAVPARRAAARRGAGGRPARARDARGVDARSLHRPRLEARRAAAGLRADAQRGARHRRPAAARRAGRSS